MELTPRAEASGVSLVRDDAPRAADQAYDACRSASEVERPVRPARTSTARWAPAWAAPERAGRPARGKNRLVRRSGVARPGRVPTAENSHSAQPERGAEQRAWPEVAVRRKRRRWNQQAETPRRGVWTDWRDAAKRGLTFELTPRAEAGGVSRDCDDSTTGAGPAYAACCSESGVERVVRPHYRRANACLRASTTSRCAPWFHFSGLAAMCFLMIAANCAPDASSGKASSGTNTRVALI